MTGVDLTAEPPGRSRTEPHARARGGLSGAELALDAAGILTQDASADELVGGTGKRSRGDVLWEYQGPRAHPILYAGILVFGFVFITGSVENLLRASRPEVFAAYALPLVATLATMAALWQGPVRIHRVGIAPARPMLLRAWRPFIRWEECAACYPVHYDVTGAFVSPFASSDGKVTQMGVGLELRSGAIEVVKFTPSRFTLGRPRSRGYKEAWPIVRRLWQDQGRPLVASAPRLDGPERERLLREARTPFLPFWAIVLLFCSAAPVTLGLAKVGLPVAWSIGGGLLFPLGTSLRSFQKSRERNRILNTLSKAALAEGSAPA